MRRFAFVVEQTLGHGAHSRNLKRALARDLEIDAAVVELGFESASRALSRLPVLSNWSLRSSLAARAALRREMRWRPLDAVFVHTQVAALLLGSVMREVPTVVSLDATPKNFDAVGRWYGHAANVALLEMAKTALYRRVLLLASELVVWCQWAADSLVADYGIPASRIHVIPPGVDLDLFQPASEARRPGPVRVLFVGGDFQRKGGGDLLAAMSMLEGAEVDIVTADRDIDVPAGVRCRLHHGLAPQSKALLHLYAAADIFALPSRSDCLPQVLAEAAASGLPIVATPVGAIPEVVEHGVNGLLVDPSSPPGLAAALRPLVGSADLRRRFGLAGRSLAVERHDASRNNAEILRLMHRAAERRQALGPVRADAAKESA